MTKPNAKRLKLATMRRQREDALHGRYVEIELPDEASTVVTLLRQPFWGPELVAAVRDDAVVTNEDMIRTVCEMTEGGDKTWAAIEACELELGDFTDIVDELTKGAPAPGESSGSSKS